MFFNMKIEVNEDQPLDEIVKHLKERGYFEDDISSENARFVYTGSSGCYFKHKADIPLISGELTTLSELKEMKCSN